MVCWVKALGAAALMTVVMASQSGLAAWLPSGDGPGQASGGPGALVFTLDASGGPRAVLLDTGLDAADDLSALDAGTGWQGRAQDLLNVLKQAARGVCGLPVLPKQIALDAGVVRLTWSAKDVCGAQSLTDLGEWAAVVPRSVQFQLPARGGQFAPADVQRFMSELSQLLCSFPLRPSDLLLSLPPARIEWSIRDMCKV